MAMLQRPNAVGLTLCRMVLIEEHLRNVTLVSIFRRLEFEAFPATAEPFFAYAVLRDGLGDVKLDLVVSRSDTLEEVYTRSLQMQFEDPLQQFRLRWIVRSCEFPAAGTYQFELRASDETITQNVLEIMEKES